VVLVLTNIFIQKFNNPLSVEKSHEHLGIFLCWIENFKII
jgi:hypothetical protein